MITPINKKIEMNNPQKLGIENIKTVLVFALQMYQAFTKGKEAKGKFKKWLIALKIALQLETLQEVVKSLKQAKNEIKDLDPFEEAELKVIIEKELDLKTNKADRIIKEALKFAISASDFVINIAKIKKENLEEEESPNA